jgi:hypothetical protein
MAIRASLLLLLSALGHGQPPVLTAQYDNTRTGANLSETVLTPRNVNPEGFGQLFTLAVDGDVVAQPLYMPRLEIPGKGIHDVLFVATEHASVYAFDAAGPAGVPLWQQSLLAPGAEPVPVAELHCSFISNEIGLTGTPVIDAASKTMYVVSRTRERGLFYQRLHAIDITTGAERPGSPVLIRASVTASRLFGLGKSEVAFHSLFQNSRAAMLLSGGNVYIAWGSSCDIKPYYGWVMAYDARTLKQTGVFNTSPDAGESGIWQANAGIAADSAGNVYAVTGNGKFTAASGGRDYGDSVLKLGLDNGVLGVRDYFTPFNEARLNSDDADLGSTGPLLLPDQPGPHPHELVVAGKAGTLYLIDRDRMGGFHAGSDSHAVQTLSGIGQGVFGAPAYWNGHLYYFGTFDVLKDFAVENGRLSTAPAHQGTFHFNDPGAVPVVSANGTRDGVVWLVLSRGWRQSEAVGVLQAYDASDISRMIYSSSTKIDRDGPGGVVRFTRATVVGGRVYIGMRGAVYVYGLLGGPKKTRDTTRPPGYPAFSGARRPGRAPRE